MAETALELLAVALEDDRGVAKSDPTHVLNMAGTLTPVVGIFYQENHVGELAEYNNSEIVRTSGELEAEGPADVYTMPVLANMVIAPRTAGVLAGGQVTGSTSLVGGSGYVPTNGSFLVTVSAPAAGGRQAIVKATVASGVITALTVVDPGYHYTSAPTLGFSGHTGTGASATATISAQATGAYLWEFIRVINADTVESATSWWGDPSDTMFEGAFTMLEEIGISGDASSEDGVMQTLKGFTQTLDNTADPTIPDIVIAPSMVGGRMQLWMEPNITAPFGTTEITGRVVSAEVTMPSGVVAKYVATGPEGTVTYTRVGRKVTHPELKISVDMVDQTQYDLFADGTTVKARVRFNGPLIEAGFYYYIQADIKGKLGDFSFGELEGTNRTMEFMIAGEKDLEIGSDLRLIIQNDSATL